MKRLIYCVAAILVVLGVVAPSANAQTLYSHGYTMYPNPGDVKETHGYSPSVTAGAQYVGIAWTVSCGRYVAGGDVDMMIDGAIWFKKNIFGGGWYWWTDNQNLRLHLECNTWAGDQYPQKASGVWWLNTNNYPSRTVMVGAWATDYPSEYGGYDVRAYSTTPGAGTITYQIIDNLDPCPQCSGGVMANTAKIPMTIVR